MRAILKWATELVMTNWNAILNLDQKDIFLKKRQKQAFKNHRNGISKLTIRKNLFGQKRKFVKQKGGAFPILANLILTALTPLGSALRGQRTKARE